MTMTTLTTTNLPNPFHRGKVRDTYDLGGGLLLMVATDRISAFDVVLPTGVPEKGVVLSRMSAFWFRKTAHIIPNHYIAMANEPAAHPHLPANLPLEIARRAMVVRRAQRIDVECVARGYIAGSAWAEYQASGAIFGAPAPKGLKEGQELSKPIFTPTTKAEAGHDMNMTIQQVVDMVGPARAAELEAKTIAVYNFAREYARQRGVIIADTKMEFGLLNGQLILIDELLTPDSSRFWDATAYSPGKSQPIYDKQFVRDWLNSAGWNHEPPAPALPSAIVQKTVERYKEAYARLTGEDPSHI
ncbi:MAG: phosphoribosylaminoimidazolesuccinocarboxamide synthase [Chloroflexi bacterium]|nr:phosphoribosylaminoimidazolesuccinocarboxamide synthase [Chloroflexota bacterium]